jgi:hypothetical protein
MSTTIPHMHGVLKMSRVMIPRHHIFAKPFLYCLEVFGTRGAYTHGGSQVPPVPCSRSALPAVLQRAESPIFASSAHTELAAARVIVDDLLKRVRQFIAVGVRYDDLRVAAPDVSEEEVDGQSVECYTCYVNAA